MPLDPQFRDSKSFLFKRLRALPSSVSCKSFACHSYENNRVYTNNSHSGTRRAPFTRALPALSFHALANYPFRNLFLLITMQTAGGVEVPR